MLLPLLMVGLLWNILQQAVLAQGCNGDSAFWEVSTRHLGEQPPQCFVQQMMVSKFDCSWQIASLDQLVADCEANPQRRIVIYSHGNWMEYGEARQRALMIFRMMCACHNQPLTFIAFTWPSERDQGFAKDIRGKKDLIDIESYYLASLITLLPADQPIGIMGFSFGTRVVSGALHLLGGGTLGGRGIMQSDAERPPYRVSLYAGAFDRDAFTSGGEYRCGLTNVEQLVNLFNSDDPVLRRFHFFERGSSPTAAGYRGLLIPCSVPNSSGIAGLFPSITQYDCRAIGRSHSETDYLRCPAMQRAMQNVLGY
ncbi:MAG: alpha/beta hydrolase [Planctomycetales bacterium]|nr:alpha/beta hydrolase [Planctomycetales bacterium]MCA9916145.1 alpha/beta hydrolase [Anaerolineae bacterium]